MKSTSSQEASSTSDKSAKASTAKKKKLKGFRTSSFKDKKDKKKGSKDAPPATGSATPVKGSDGKESRSRESSFPGGQNADGESGFEVQKLNMADFLGS